MPLKISSALRRHTRPRFANALLAALAFALVCLFVIPDGPTYAQRGGKRAAAQAPSQAANDNAAAPKKETPKRVYVGGGSSTPQGSRVTIKSDNPLNDYSAYRSGDRFYVVVPGASAGSVAKGASGRGYSDMQVQQRGKDVVLSYKVQPGAKPKVEQKFNRLDVVFEAAEGAGATPDNTRAAKPPTPANQTPVMNAQANNRTPANAANQSGAERNINRPVANATSAGQTSASAPSVNSSAPPAGLIESGSQPAMPPVAEQSPAATPEATPAAEEQLAQAQPPTTTAPITTTTSTTQTNASTGTSIGAVVMRNWPLALTLALLVVGIGLFFAARRSSATSRPTPEVPADAGGTLKVEGARAAKLKGASASPAQRAAESKPAAGTSSAAATLAAAGLGSAAAVEGGTEKKKKKAKERAREEKVVAGENAGAIASAASAETSAEGAALSGLAAAALSKETEPAAQKEVVPVIKGVEPAVALDGDVVQTETKRLLDGEAFDARVVGTSDVMARQMIAAELLAALTGRNVARQARARAAFVEHGYFDETVKDLRGASAPAERASAARSLGLTAERTATPHLVAALEDSAVEVRRASVEA
nr:HEAT repeat domain-containing protein [Acidobacteriota bacterium]